MDWDSERGHQVLGHQHAALKKALADCLADMPTAPIDTADTRQLIACCIFATILQTATECVDLMEKSTSVTCVGGMIRGAAIPNRNDPRTGSFWLGALLPNPQD
jgi:hypothetical protein